MSSQTIIKSFTKTAIASNYVSLIRTVTLKKSKHPTGKVKYNKIDGNAY